MHDLILLAVLAPASAQLSTVNDAVGKFSMSLLKATAQENENTIHSPYSIWTALGMCLVGAKGQTLTNMKQNMYIDALSKEDFEAIVKSSTARIELARSTSNTSFTVAVANRVYVNESYPISEKFVSAIADVFDAVAKSVNFRADGPAIQSEVNEFVSNATQGLIPKLLDQALDAETLIALLNALYFKGSWAKNMRERRAPGKFNEDVKGGQTAQWFGVTDGFPYGHSDDLGATLIELAYAGNFNTSDSASMIIVFPDDEYRSGFQSWLTSKLSNWTTIARALESIYFTQVDLTMPKFDIESSFELSDVLKALGMLLPFSDDADFNEIGEIGAERLKISKVIHKAKMSVDEKGTVAAAATVVTMVRALASFGGEPQKLIIDRSFVAFIILRQENRKSILPLFTAVINKIR